VRADRVVGRDGSIEGDVDGVCGGGTVSFDRGTF
jgi:pectin methylesterase-like acyl-CoA thioesterase